MKKNEVSPVIHSDVWYAPLVSISGYQYFVSFIDEAKMSTWLYLIKSHDECLQYLKTSLSKKFNTKIQVLWSGNEEDYTSKEFQSFLADNGSLKLQMHIH